MSAFLSRLFGRNQDAEPDQPSDEQPRVAIRDLVYLDFEKTASIYSQIRGGLPTETQESLEGSSNADVRASINTPLASVGSTLGSAEKRSQIETRVLHHDLLFRVEQSLFELGLAVDLNSARTAGSSVDQIRQQCMQFAYVRFEGWIRLEDHARMRQTAQVFNDLIEFIGRSSLQSAAGDSPDLAKLLLQLDNAHQELEATTKDTDRGKAILKLRRTQRQYREILKTVTDLGAVDDWIIDGLKLWIDTFMPNRIVLRAYPFDDIPEFHVMASLKPDSFADTDVDNVMLAYGLRPDVKLTLLGLVTSIPEQGEHPFDPMAEFDIEHGEEPPERQFERAFRAMFSTLGAFEGFSRFLRYPRVAVYPLALYRHIVPPPQP